MYTTESEQDYCADMLIGSLENDDKIQQSESKKLHSSSTNLPHKSSGHSNAKSQNHGHSSSSKRDPNALATPMDI